MKGKVYLVGAGPGDGELLTCKAFRLIREADCIVYDRLVNPGLLAEAGKHCEKIYAGKENKHHSMKQEEINRLLADKAEECQTVVRLKGGDVYVFGRGGEEALYLRGRGVEFEVVPGISSCMAGLAYAGIPITHRGLAGGFHVVTAHDKQDQLAQIDFQAMAAGRDTCVFLMGLSKLAQITAELLAAGKDGNTPSAVIANATLPSQQVVTGALQDIARKVEEHALPSPALIVVGEVAALRQRLNFFEEKALFGRRILLPRPGDNPSLLGEKLLRLGAWVTQVQTSHLTEYASPLDNLRLEAYTHIIFTSKNAVRFFFHGLRKNRVDIRSLSHAEFAAVGSATVESLEEWGIYPSIMPDIFHQDALLEAMTPYLKKTDRILLPGVDLQEEGISCDRGLEQGLRQICRVETVALYGNQAVSREAIKQEMAGCSFDLAVFTCSSSVRNLIRGMDGTDFLQNKKIIAIGDKTSRTLRENGIENVIQAEKATFDSLVETVLHVVGECK